MILQKQVLEQLKDDFRLNIYEVKIWTSLLSRGMATAGELAEISGVPRSRCYDVLESLEKKGFVVMKIGKPIKYIAISPKEIVDRVKKSLIKEKETTISIIDNVKATDMFKELELLHKSGIEHIKAEDISDSIIGRSNINRFVKSLIEKAESSIIIAADQESVLKILNSNESAISRLQKKGADIVVFSNVEPSIQKKNKLKFIKFQPNNFDARLIIIDGKEMLIFTSKKGSSADFESAIWFESRFFVSGFSRMFLKHN